MTSSNRLWLMALPVFALSFAIGVMFNKPGRKPVAPISASSTPSDFTAPHKPTVAESLKTPTPGPSLDLPEPDGPDAPGSNPVPAGGTSYWVVQDNAALYAAKGLNQSVLERLACSTPITLLREEDDWVEVQVVGGNSGWMKHSQVNDRPPPGAPGPRPGDALASLQGFFTSLNQHNYAKAYDHLSFDFKRDLPYRRFSQGYSSLDQVVMRVVRVQTISPQSELFYLEMLCEERPKSKTYQGEYTMVLEQNHWYIAQATMKEVDPKSMGAFQLPPGASPKPAFADPTPEPPEDEFGE
ncbi:hypothetical protein JST97_34505 [bacterium]|nr:hypothetical protein [bacterium]